jgi:hypothetical protein
MTRKNGASLHVTAPLVDTVRRRHELAPPSCSSISPLPWPRTMRRPHRRHDRLHRYRRQVLQSCPPTLPLRGGAGWEGWSPASLTVTGRELSEWASLLSPFFFWGTAMNGVIPGWGPLSSLRCGCSRAAHRLRRRTRQEEKCVWRHRSGARRRHWEEADGRVRSSQEE